MNNKLVVAAKTPLPSQQVSEFHERSPALGDVDHATMPTKLFSEPEPDNLQKQVQRLFGNHCPWFVSTCNSKAMHNMNSTTHVLSGRSKLAPQVADMCLAQLEQLITQTWGPLPCLPTSTKSLLAYLSSHLWKFCTVQDQHALDPQPRRQWLHKQWPWLLCLLLLSALCW